jgi:hypothetical protein
MYEYAFLMNTYSSPGSPLSFGKLYSISIYCNNLEIYYNYIYIWELMEALFDNSAGMNATASR